MSLLASRAERIKLATTLVVQPDEIAYLDQIPALQVHRVRTAVLEWVFDQERPTFQRFAAALKWLPSSLLALLAARYFPALPLARVAGELPAHKAMAVAVRLPPALIADVCTHLDPRRAPDLVRLIPAPVIVAIALELVERRDYITMSQFVDFLADDTIEAVIQAIDDETHLVHIAYFVESKNRLDHLVRMMPRERLRRAILLVLDESQAIMLEVISLIVHVSYALKRELGELAAAQDERVLNRIIRTTHTHGIWADLLPVVATLSPDTQRKVVNLPLLKEDPEVLQSILEAANRHGLWLTVLPLIGMLDNVMRDAVARFGAELPFAAKERVADAALIGEHWEAVADIVARMPEEAQAEIGAILLSYGEVDAELLARLTRLADGHGFGRFLRAPA